MPVRVKPTNLVYVPVPKAACTSIKYGLLAQAHPDLVARLDAGTARHLRTVHDWAPSVPLHPKHQLRYATRRWFCVVRDPVARFLSGYGNRVVHYDDLAATAAAVEAAGLPRHPDLLAFVDNLERYMALNKTIKHHFLPMVRFLGRRPKRYDRIFRMTELSDLVAYLAAAGAPITLPHKQTGGPKLKRDALPAKSLARLEKVYAADYDAYGAWFD